MSNVLLNKNDINLLNKGSKYCLPERRFEGDIKLSIINFIRSIKLRNYFFNNKCQSNNSFLPLTNNSFYPKESDTIETNNFSSIINSIIIKDNFHIFKENKDFYG